MDEKIFNLLETMYSDLTNRIDNMGKDLKQDIARLEDKMDQNHISLYDGYKLTYEKLEILEEKVNKIDEKVERQDVEIRVIKNVK